MIYLKFFLISLPIFAVLDFIWLGLLMSKFYNAELGTLARRAGESLSPHWPSAILAYIVLVLGVALFVLPKFIDKPIGFNVFIWGALFGLVVYGVYDLTNYATLANWPLKVVIVDIIWGMFIYGSTALVASYIAKYFGII